MSPGTLERQPPDQARTLTTPDARKVRADDAPAAETQPFLPGARFGRRYRIVELLGRGGMGEVYRADDLQLGQSVALKFLPRHLSEDETALARMRNEVRAARQIAHPNVCRVYDIAEVDAQVFLSMEYVDGEDLGSVLRRLGRPTREKAQEIARQLCLGVAAAHDRGVLHRDLKPANVMIDGRGRVRITDFGVASFVRELRGTETRGGTPAYMAPELLGGQPGSARSDVFSLGLVLYELFTGRPAFEADSVGELQHLQEAAAPPRPSRFVEDIDPEVERTILRCLEQDPQARPRSALALARAFPGTDPLAAVVEAGETPSPDMVADAGPQAGLPPLVGLACLGVLVAGSVAIGVLAERTTLYGLAPVDKPAVVLAERAREVVRQLGYTAPDRDSYFRYDVHWPAVQYFARQDRSTSRWDRLAEPGQIAIFFRYRQSPIHLIPSDPSGQVRFDEPYPAPGNINVSLGLDGRLLRLEAIPSFAGDLPASAGPVDWSPAFAAAGLNMSDFQPIRPAVRPRVHSGDRAAWQGVLPHRNDMPVRVEAAALAGRIVFFETVTPSDPYWSAETARSMERALTDVATYTVNLILLIVIVSVALVLAVLNWRRGRGDRRGALRLAVFVLLLRLLYWITAGHHVPELIGELEMFVGALGLGLVLALLTWVYYMALEPYFRRLWPQALVSWTRLLSGRLHDPLVGRDVVIGLAFGVLLVLAHHLALLAPAWFGLPPVPPQRWAVEALPGGRWAVGEFLNAELQALAEALAYAFLFLAVRFVLRRAWLTAAGFAGLIAAFGALQFTVDPSGATVWARMPFGAAAGVVMASILMLLLVRFGLLAMAACMAMACALVHLPVTVDAGAPYFGGTLLIAGFAAGLAAYAMRISWTSRAGFGDPSAFARTSG